MNLSYIYLEQLSEVTKNRVSHKYIICDYAASEIDTHSIIKDINLLLRESHFITSIRKDYKVFERGRKRVVTVDYVGKYRANSDNEILDFIYETENPDIIVCNSLSWGKSLDNVEDLNKNGYKVILFRSFFEKDKQENKESMFNDISAHSVFRIIRRLLFE